MLKDVIDNIRKVCAIFVVLGRHDDADDKLLAFECNRLVCRRFSCSECNCKECCMRIMDVFYDIISNIIRR